MGLKIYSGSEETLGPVLSEAIWNEEKQILSWEFQRGKVARLSIVYKMV